MAVAVTTDSLFFTGATTGSSNGDTITDWTGVPTPTIDTAQFIQGAGALQSYSAGATTSRTWIFASASTSVTNKAVYFWFALGKVSFLATKALSGLTLTIESTTPTAGTATWKVAGSDTLPHNGFICHAVDTNVTPDSTTGTLAKGSIIKVTITANGTFPGKAYLWVDALRTGTKLSITGGDGGTPATWNDFVTAEETVANRYGILERFGGVIFVQGKIEIGKTDQTATTYFEDTSQSIVFKNSIFTSSFYNLTIQGANGFVTTCKMGTAVGTKGVSGCTFRLASATQTPIYTVTATNAYLTTLGLYGCSFLNAGTITLPDYDTNKNVYSTSFEKCAEIIAGTGTMNGCNFISSAGRAIRISSASHNVTNSNFINCQTAVHHNVGGAIGSPLHIDYSSLIFTGGTYHIENSAVTPNFYIDIDRIGTPVSNPDVAKINNSGGGTTTILAISVQLTLTGLIAGSDVRILNAGTQTVLGETDNSGTTFNYSYNYGAYPNVDIVVLHLDYEYFRLESFTPGATNASMPIPLRIDRNYLE